LHFTTEYGGDIISEGRWSGSSTNSTTHAKAEHGKKPCSAFICQPLLLYGFQQENKKFELRVKFNPVG